MHTLKDLLHEEEARRVANIHLLVRTEDNHFGNIPGHGPFHYKSHKR